MAVGIVPTAGADTGIIAMPDSGQYTITTLLPPETFNWIDSFADGLAPVSTGDWDNRIGIVNRRFGFINMSGEIVIPLEYESAQPFSEGLAAVGRDNLWGYINTRGEVVIPFDFGYALPFSEGFATVSNWNDSAGLLSCKVIDTSGEVVFVFEDGVIPLDNFSPNGVIRVASGESWGLINSSGEMVVPFGRYDFIGEFSEGMAPAYIYGNDYMPRAGFINTSGEAVIPLEYGGTRPFSEGLAAVFLGEQWSFIDTSGVVQFTLAPEFDAGSNSSTGFSNGFAVIRRSFSHRFINTSGEIAFPTGYIEANNFVDGFAIVGRLDGTLVKYGVIDTNGDVVIPLEYQGIVYNGIADGATIWSVQHFWGNGNPPLAGLYAVTVNEGFAPCTCLNCADCGHLGGRFGFGRLRGADEPPAVQDALAILRQLVGLSSLIDGNEDARIAANITRPGEAGNPSVQDALQILRKLVGLPNMIDNPELRPA
jgi:hypothetical protein